MYYCIFSCARTVTLYSEYKHEFKLFTPLARARSACGKIVERPILYGVIYVPEHYVGRFIATLHNKFYVKQWLYESGIPKRVLDLDAQHMQVVLNEEWSQILQKRKAGRKKHTVVLDEPHPFSVGDRVNVILHDFVQSGVIERLKADGRIRVALEGTFLDVPHTLVQFSSLQMK